MGSQHQQRSHLAIRPLLVVVLLTWLAHLALCCAQQHPAHDEPWTAASVGLARRFKRSTKDSAGVYGREPLLTWLATDPLQDDASACATLRRLNEAKRAMMFTPRLGRDAAGEEAGRVPPTSDRWLQDNEFSGSMMSQRSPPFAPRLGRSYWSTHSS